MNLPSNELVIVTLRHPATHSVFSRGILNSETSRWTSFQGNFLSERKESPFQPGFQQVLLSFHRVLNLLPVWEMLDTRWFPEPWIGFKEEPVAKTSRFSSFWFNCQTWKVSTLFPSEIICKEDETNANLGIPISLRQILPSFSLDSVMMENEKNLRAHSCD